MGMCSPLAIKDKRTMPQNKIPDKLVTILPSGLLPFFKCVKLSVCYHLPLRARCPEKAHMTAT